MAKIQITGLDDLRRALRQAGDLAIDALASSAVEEAEKIMTDSKSNYVPVDLNTLRASGTVLPPKKTGTRVEVEMGYGGAAKAYAIVQHERLGYRHTVGGPKYLERPFLAAMPTLGRNLAEGVRRAWARLAK